MISTGHPWVSTRPSQMQAKKWRCFPRYEVNQLVLAVRTCPMGKKEGHFNLIVMSATVGLCSIDLKYKVKGESDSFKRNLP